MPARSTTGTGTSTNCSTCRSRSEERCGTLCRMTLGTSMTCSASSKELSRIFSTPPLSPSSAAQRCGEAGRPAQNRRSAPRCAAGLAPAAWRRRDGKAARPRAAAHYRRRERSAACGGSWVVGASGSPPCSAPRVPPPGPSPSSGAVRCGAGTRQGHCDGLTFVHEHRTQPSLPSPPRGSACSHWPHPLDSSIDGHS